MPLRPDQIPKPLEPSQSNLKKEEEIRKHFNFEVKFSALAIIFVATAITSAVALPFPASGHSTSPNSKGGSSKPGNHPVQTATQSVFVWHG